MKTRTRLKNYFVIAIALLSLIALAGSAQAAVTVDKNHPGYVFSNITNVMTAYVTNSGAAPVAVNVSIKVTNATGFVLNSSKTIDVTINAGATESVNLGTWMPDKAENITINVTAEGHDTRIEVRNTTGSCADDVNPKYEKIFEKECYGYRGQHSLTQAYTGGSDVIYTVGDYKYQNTTVNFTIGAPGGDVNRVDSYIADIPDSADIEQATLYLYHAWRRFELYGWWDWTMQFTNSTGTYTVAENLNYTDCKGFGTSYMRERLYGTIVYDVTDYVTGNGSYSASVTGDLYPWHSTSYGYVSGMALMVVYDDGTPMVYRIAHGHDRLATYYNFESTSTSSYHVVPANATTSATLMDANSSGDVTYARLFTATVDGVDYTTGLAGGESQKCNNCTWDVGAWTNDGMGDFNHPIGFGRDNVTGCLSGAGSNEIVEMQERDASDNKNGYSVVFALMQACNRTLTDVTSCGDDGNEKHSFAQGEKVYVKGCGLATSTYKIWIQNYPVNEGYTLTADNCTDCDGVNWSVIVTTDGSGCFDATEVWNISATAPITYKQYDIVVDNQDAGTVGTFKSGAPDKDGIDDACVEGFLAPVPEFATIALFGMGLLMLAGYVHLGRRRKRA